MSLLSLLQTPAKIRSNRFHELSGSNGGFVGDRSLSILSTDFFFSTETSLRSFDKARLFPTRHQDPTATIVETELNDAQHIKEEPPLS